MPKKHKKIKTVKKLKNKSKLNVIFDIDDTLIHVYFSNKHHMFSTGINHNTEYNLSKTTTGVPFIYFIRNYAHFLLNYCLNNFNVSIWSNGDNKYIIPLLKNFLTNYQYKKLNLIISVRKKNNKYTEYIEENSKKTFKINMVNKTRLKPLEYLFDNYKNFNLKNTLLIDDGSYNISVNPFNSIYVPEYCLKNNDNYLFKVYQWLDKHGKKKDIRNIDKKIFNYDDKVNNDCLIYDKYVFSNNKLKLDDYVEYKKGGLTKYGYITKINKNKYDMVEFNEGDLNENDFKFTKYKGLDKSSLRKIII